MSSLQEAQAKWERKTANAGSKWESMKGQMKQNFASSAKYSTLGVSPGPQTVASYSREIDATPGSRLQNGVSGKGSKWAEGFRQGFSK
jgi:hypothetical protein